MGPICLSITDPNITRYDLELYSLEPLDFCTLDTLNYTRQMPYITHGFLRADSRMSMGFILLYGKKTISRWGFRHSVLEATRRPVCHVLFQRCEGADALDDGAASSQLQEAAKLLTEAGFREYLPGRWAKPGCEDRFWQGAANGMDVLAFGAGAYTYLEGMVTRNTTDLKTYLAYSADYEKLRWILPRLKHRKSSQKNGWNDCSCTLVRKRRGNRRRKCRPGR